MGRRWYANIQISVKRTSLKKSKAKRRKIKGFFFLDVPIYEGQVAVIVGMTHKEVVAKTKRLKCNESFMKALCDEDTVEMCRRVYDPECETQGVAMQRNGTHFFLVLGRYQNDWSYLDVLNHECFHLTQYISQKYTMWDYLEPPAYLHSFLFRELRKKLSKL